MDFPIISNDMPKFFSSYRADHPTAIAVVHGNKDNQSIRGEILFYQLDDGVYIKAYVIGLPATNSKGEPTKFHGFHIHERGDCSIGASENPFSSTGDHFNPSNNKHPFHDGDLPPILSANGIGILSFFTNSFRVIDILERSIIIHENSDDFTTQPSGSSGKKIACGIILPYHY